MGKWVIALAGNPNSGKTTLFNRLTGAHQITGNWPGVTVERKEGLVRGRGWKLVDLPGAYSLDAFSPEEQVTRDLLLKDPPDLVLNIIDATAMERSLFFTMQLLDAGLPVVVALNLSDQLEKEKGWVDQTALSQRLGVPVIPISARTGENLPELLRSMEKLLRTGGEPSSTSTQKGGPVWERISQTLSGAYSPGRAGAFGPGEKLDGLLLHRVLAIPIFLGAAALMFWLIFGPPGVFLKGMAETLTKSAGFWLDGFLRRAGAADWACSLAVEGIWAGVGGVLTFLPQMAILFLFLSLLEDSGYMARAALVTDRALRGTKLSGKAFIPILMGFGCTTSAVLACRALPSGERRLAVLFLPFVSCSAKLPVYILFSAAFFPKGQGMVIFGLYLLGMAVGFFRIWIAGKRALGKELPFLLELPPYRIPTFYGTMRHLWDKCAGFVAKAGTVIVSLSALVWLTQQITPTLDPALRLEDSLFAFFGRTAAPFFAPLGFGSWQAASALLAGIIAKEGVVSTLAGLYGGQNLSVALQSTFTPASALSFLTFVLLYLPCVSALAVIRRELGGWKASLWAMTGQMAAAYAVSFLIYRAALVILGG